MAKVKNTAKTVLQDIDWGWVAGKILQANTCPSKHVQSLNRIRASADDSIVVDQTQKSLRILFKRHVGSLTMSEKQTLDATIPIIVSAYPNGSIESSYALAIKGEERPLPHELDNLVRLVKSVPKEKTPIGP